MRIRFDRGISTESIIKHFKEILEEELENECGVINIYIQEFKNDMAIPFEETEQISFKSIREKDNGKYI